MTPEEREIVSELFEAALELEPGRRKAFLDGARVDKAIYDEVLSLLAAHDEAAKKDFMKEPVLGPSASPAISETVFLRLSERYELLGEIGIGGMSRVYKARDRNTEEVVAIKILNPAVSTDAMERFKDELRLARKITHKNVCRIYELHPVETTAYISMELVQGDSLNELLPRFGGLPLRKGVEVALQICDGLEEAHRQGVVHRDLKPGNIMVDREGNAKVMDFGIAYSADLRATDGAAIIGTPNYMAPEQIEGKTVDARADIYAFGLILHDLFSGKAASPDKASPTRELDTSIPKQIGTVIHRCLEKNPEERYASVAELRSALADILDSKEVILSGPVSTRRAALTGLLSALCLGAGFLVRGYWFQKPAPGPMHHEYGPVWDLAYNQKGNMLASAGEDGIIWIWDPTNKSKPFKLTGHINAVAALGFSLADDKLVSGDSNGAVRIWDTQTRREIEPLLGHSQVIEAVAYAQDGKMIAFGCSDDNSVKLWDVEKRMMRRLEGHQAEIRSVSFSPDGLLLASGSKDKKLIIWDTKTEKQKRKIEGHSDWIEKVIFSPKTGKWVAAGDYGNQVKLWDVATGGESQPIGGHEADVISLSFSRDEMWLASASDDGEAKIWDPIDPAKEPVHTIPSTGRGQVKAVAFHPKKSSAGVYQLALGFEDGTIELHPFEP